MIAAEEFVRLEDRAAETDRTVLSVDTVSRLQTYLIEVGLFCLPAEIAGSLSESVPMQAMRDVHVPEVNWFSRLV